MIDRGRFFSSVRSRPFHQHLAQFQVDGMNAMLQRWEQSQFTDPRWFAYMLATVFHETNATIQPISEIGSNAYFFRMYDIDGARPSVARALGNVRPGDGTRYHGLGLAQITGRANFAKFGKALGIPLVENPHLALRMDVALDILFTGMTTKVSGGSFTGKELDDYFNDTTDDPINARRIINGRDKADEIAATYHDFLNAVLAASV